MTREETFMNEAIRLSQVGMQNNEGGPFGCVIVKDDDIVGRGWNRVLATNDPTAHAEVVAIRDACHNLNSFHLEGCELYTSCEPCPMCLGAIYWAQLKKIYYANTRNDADAIGFNDSFIYDELSSPHENRNVKMISLGREDALKIFEQWSQKGNKKLY